MRFVKFTGHPLPDVGLATICAMVRKSGPEELSISDFDVVADELAGYYFSGLMTSYLSCVFMNSEYVQPKQSKRAQYESRVLRAHRWTGDSEARGLKCVYSSEPATHLVHRSQIPMLTGQDVINFFPAGRGALPVAGPYLAAIQAVPMGGRRAEGRLLFAHSDDGGLTVELAMQYVADNRRLLNLAKLRKLPAKDGPDEALVREHGARDQKTKEAKYPDAKSPTSLVISDLLNISTTGSGSRAERPQASMTVYLMSNSGQGPSLEFHHIPSQLVRFLRLVNRSPTGATWRALVARSWRATQEGRGTGKEADSEGAEPERKVPKGRTEQKQPLITPGPGRSRNDLLVDLLPIFDSGFTDLRAARFFLRRHVLRQYTRTTSARPSGASSRQAVDSSLIDWNLVKLFLREVIGMDEKRINKIQDFADTLAKHISSTNDKALFQNLIFAERSWQVRNALTKAQRNEAREHNVLLFGLQDYLALFEADDAAGTADWGLVRDLISIRLIETLHAQSFFKQETKDWLQEPESQASTPAA
jgi:CRISPR-associated protein Cst1